MEPTFPLPGSPTRTVASINLDNPTPAPRTCGLPLGISSERQRAKHCRYNSDERKVLSEQHPVIMQAFNAMNNRISLLRFTCDLQIQN